MKNILTISIVASVLLTNSMFARGVEQPMMTKSDYEIPANMKISSQERAEILRKQKNAMEFYAWADKFYKPVIDANKAKRAAKRGKSK